MKGNRRFKDTKFCQTGIPAEIRPLSVDSSSALQYRQNRERRPLAKKVDDAVMAAGRLGCNGVVMLRRYGRPTIKNACTGSRGG